MYCVRGFAWAWMALRARNAPPSGHATFNRPSTCHGPRPGPKLAHGVRAGSLCAIEPRARGKTRGRKRKKCRRVKTHLYIHVYIYTRFPFGAKFHGVKNTASTTNQGVGMCIESAQSKRGRRERYYVGCEPSLRICTSGFF